MLTLAVAGVLVLGGCQQGPQRPRSEAPPIATETSGPKVPSALTDPADPRFPTPLVELDDLVAGGPPPDGIPSIDAPRFEPVEDVGWLAEQEPLLSLTVADETRGYPLQIMTWHEIVNDDVDGVPVAVTYCPLCNSGVAFERRVAGDVLDFGVSGLLYADNLVMFDRQTESLWPQLTGRASVGVLTGTQLTAIPMGVVGWAQFRAAHPDALVMTPDTGFDRDYGRNPYPGYDRPDGQLLVGPPGGPDPRLQVKTRVVGVRAGSSAVAVTRERVAGAGVIDVVVGGRRLVIWHQQGQTSALSAQRLMEGEEIGSVAVFTPRVRGRNLTFTRRSGHFIDLQTQSTWDIFGTATAGPLKGQRLRPHQHLDTFWFAWAAFQPDTEIVR